jgi:hypothetical protein
MYRRNRPEDRVFGPDELLFRRYLQSHWIDGSFSPLGFRFAENSGQSVNRQKYSEPEDVLFLNGTFDDEWGVLEFAVRDIPQKLSEDPAPAFVFFPKHVPEELNFAHSEVWVWSDREEGTGGYAAPSKAVRKLLRAKLSQRVTIRI